MNTSKTISGLRVKTSINAGGLRSIQHNFRAIRLNQN